jgi:hypothetical protein
MSQQDVHEIICPAIERERDELRTASRNAEQHVLWLRRRLLRHEPDLSRDEYDGNHWRTIQVSEP